ncbi:hypothetical protein [Poriferisphaera sp. WC338]
MITVENAAPFVLTYMLTGLVSAFAIYITVAIYSVVVNGIYEIFKQA